MFSIIIPTFNNIDYLKLCIKSIKKNSSYDHEIIIHINEGEDGTLEYVKENNFLYSFSKINKGVCTAFNKSVELSSKKFIVLAHDDMYFCPNWDNVFASEIAKLSKNKDFFMSGIMVQPFKSYINLDCGKTYEVFDEEKLLNEVGKIEHNDFQGTHWQPSLIPRQTWDKVGGFSEEFNPGLGSDPDFNMKLWKSGVRLFKGLANSRVYHFSSVSLRKKAWNNGAKTFLLKWGISIKFFKKFYLKTDTVYNGELKEPVRNFQFILGLFICKLNFFYTKYIYNLSNIKKNL
jgi:glycosyltransferase involved in cell wall biosynthesis